MTSIQERQADVVIVGAGIVGLAHAFAFAKRGMSVVVFERNPRACGASVRNFGMVWPIGQTAGRWHQLAMLSRRLWLEAASGAGLWHEQVGSLHVAHHDDEWTVLGEFATAADELGFPGELLTATQALSRSAYLNPDGLRGAFWSPTEICVDPREAVGSLPVWLERVHGVRFHFNTAVTAVEQGMVLAGGESWECGRTVVCGGDDFQTLFPEIFAASGIVRCKLQMMRSAPLAKGARIGPMLAGGLTLCHYPSFAHCAGLGPLRERIARDQAEMVRHGIHVMASQNGLGELTIGDSHAYGMAVDIFDQPEIDRLILDYLRTFLAVPDLTIAQRWHGVYAKHPDLRVFRACPAAGIDLITVTSGIGMTLSFGLGEETAVGSVQDTVSSTSNRSAP